MTDKVAANAQCEISLDELPTPMTVEDLQQLTRDGASRTAAQLRQQEAAARSKRRKWVENLVLLPDLDKRVHAAVMKAAAAGRFECPLLIVDPPTEYLPHPDWAEYRQTTSMWRGMKVARPRRRTSWLLAFRSAYTFHDVRAHLFTVVRDRELRAMLITALIEHNVAGVAGIQYEWRTRSDVYYRHDLHSLYAVWK